MRSTVTATTINIEVAFATPGNQILFGMTVPEGATVSTVLEACATGALLPEHVLRNPDVGVFGRRVEETYMLQAGDRVEFYRALVADPKDTRRRRASTGRRRPATNVK